MGLDRGRQRETNEDFAVIDEALGFGLVADGVGGRAGGDRAARLAAETVHSVVREQRWVLDNARKNIISEEVAKLLRFAVVKASQLIFDEARQHPEHAGMSTTCTFCLDLGKKGLIGHVGDSRAYLIRAGEATRLTEDHVAVIREGNEERRALARALGAQRDVAVDLLWVDLRGEDRLVLCTDGVSDQIPDPHELVVALDAFGSKVAPDLLIDLVNCRGGPDNEAVVVIDREPGSIPDRAREAWEDVRPQLDVLRSLPLFSKLSYLDLEQLRAHVSVESVAAGEDLAPDEDQPWLGIIARGEADLDLGCGVRERVGVGAVLGETAVGNAAAWPYRATAVSDLSVVTLPVSVVRGFASQNQRAAFPVLDSLLRAASARLSSLTRAARGPAGQG